MLLIGGVVVELWLAALVMPYNWLVPPDAYTDQRFTESQLIADQADQTVPGRVLSISGLLFDPGDRATLEARYADLPPEARALAFDAVKLKETLGANLPLIWDIPSVDGYDGGVAADRRLHRLHLAAAAAGELRTVDGRLREILALPECGGACIPDQRWLDLMGVRYLITDKVYDLVNDGMFYDTTVHARRCGDLRQSASVRQHSSGRALQSLRRPARPLLTALISRRARASASAITRRIRFAVDPPSCAEHSSPSILAARFAR